ncbi:hypothetical protein [Sinimarinibacterium sp. NLF-5-8]|uniref:hypothetical protein n=1 Tax=Sinimarinibacterium sp. NLF-5-8 TaxID=2698684 RepID=UPI00137B95F6|nr:hypothetical protein [Sinimarinibacterium sp. NLF-5-8]QHS09013.1 hypothetical protein GT972_01880 [Sinimarinibacterium sp. NLF-5-8]
MEIKTQELPLPEKHSGVFRYAQESSGILNGFTVAVQVREAHKYERPEAKAEALAALDAAPVGSDYVYMTHEEWSNGKCVQNYSRTVYQKIAPDLWVIV